MRRSAGRISKLKWLKKFIPSTPQHAIDSVAEIGNVHVHVRNSEPDRGELRNTNDNAAFLRYCRTHDAASNSIRRGVPDRFGNFRNQSG
jgi:hypothetical protein